ncbi:site-specific integrase [Pseudonocardia nigra]|uniref:site-specific integrase n=1 Tax=Pseudonocardia nigra TaxID=1921578 RepID=UPI001C5D515C|nr:site-specific integrase [Pseudonocardia nigra]
MRRHVPKHRLEDLDSEAVVSLAQRAVLARAFELAQAAGWSSRSLDGVVAGLRAVLGDQPDGRPIRPIRLSQIRAATGMSRGPRIARIGQILDEFGLLVDDTVPTIRAWIDHTCEQLPVGFRDEVRAWLLVLLDGDARSRPRSQSTLHAYLGRVRPPVLAWSATRSQLREVTEDDVRAVLDELSGHLRAGTFVALRSLFRFAKRRRLVFADPTRRLHVGRTAPVRTLAPMTDAQIAAVGRVAVTPAQRLIVALAAVHAARAKTIRELTLDDIDLPGRRIRLGGHPQQLSAFVHDVLAAWLRHRHHHWPHTPNRHMLISTVTASGTEPITDYYLTWHLLLHGVQLEHIRGDRVLQEALAVGADPLHLAVVFHLSFSTAIAYADIARSLLERPSRTPPRCSTTSDTQRIRPGDTRATSSTTRPGVASPFSTRPQRRTRDSTDTGSHPRPSRPLLLGFAGTARQLESEVANCGGFRCENVQ